MQYLFMCEVTIRQMKTMHTHRTEGPTNGLGRE